MPTFTAKQIAEISQRVLVGAGTPPEDATIVGQELSLANLFGHDSHGIIRLKQYVDYIQVDVIKPGAAATTIVELGGIAVLDGGANFGQVTAHRALDLATTRAKEVGAYSVLCRNSNHVGRLGSYTQQGAEQGFACMMAVNGPGQGGGVAPWGAAERRMGTNPISIAAPRGDQPLVLDMTTSATAEGKVRVALQKGEALPEGWIMDGAGQPSTNPADLYGNPEEGIKPGAILPLGGPMGFKGFGMGVMMDVFCGMLSGYGVARADLPPGTNGIWLYVVDIAQVSPEFGDWMEHYVDHLKSTLRQPDVAEILLPGEIENGRRAVREQEGIEVPDGTWQQTLDLAESLGVSLAEWE